MEIKEIGEFGLIELLAKDAVVNEKNIVVGIGDDAAALRVDKDLLQLISTDMLMEGIHFDLSFMTPFQLGYKAMAANLSDIAAMGGMPRHAVVSIAIPRRLDAEFVIELYRGLKASAAPFRVNIVGGDTVSSRHDLAINVAVTGDVLPERLTLRSTAKAGDLVVVTGLLGLSSAGLSCLQAGMAREAFAPPLCAAHLLPQPQVALAQIAAVHASAMNDISDGLASEAAEIASASGVGILLEEKWLPISKELEDAAKRLGQSALDFILYGGEDYQLVFTVPETAWDLLRLGERGESFTKIGYVTQEKNCVSLRKRDQSIVKIKAKGYNHFI